MEELENQNQPEEIKPEQDITSESDLQNAPIPQTEEQEVGEEAVENYSTFSKEEIVTAVEGLSDEDITAAKHKIFSLKDVFDQIIAAEKETALASFIEQGGNKDDFEFSGDALNERFFAAIKKYNKRKAEYLEQAEKKRDENLKDKLAILNEFKSLIQNEENMQRAFEQFHELQNKWRNTGAVPSAKAQDLWMTYKLYSDKFYELIKRNRELQDLDWRKNLEMKMVLCEKAEELILEPSLNKALSNLGALQNRWREVGPVSRDKKNELWERFKAATDKIYERRKEHFNEVKIKQQKNIEEKKVLLEKIQQLIATPVNKANEWIEKGKEVAQIQNDYKKIGFADKKSNEEVWIKFKAACDSFYHSKNEFFQTIKKEFATNQQLKTDLIVHAENLKESTDWKKATEEIKQLQVEWKKIGSSGEKSNQRIWERFRAACDGFFERKKQHYNNIETEQQDNLIRKSQLTDEVEAFISSEAADENIEHLKNFQRRWSELGNVPFEKKNEIQSRFKAAIDKHFNAIDGKQREQRKSGNYEWKPTAKPGTEKGSIHNRMSSLEHEVQTWENNLGFFAKSKNADSLKQEFEDKINKAKEEIKKLKEQLQNISHPV
jgi:Domain of Unknown Function (DUF349)